MKYKNILKIVLLLNFFTCYVLGNTYTNEEQSLTETQRSKKIKELKRQIQELENQISSQEKIPQVKSVKAQLELKSKATEIKSENLIKDCHLAHEIGNHLIHNNWTAVEKYIKFPYKRKFPLRPVSQKEFSENPKLIFDNNFILNFKIKKMGTKGCMINNGVLWVDFDSNGGKIQAINYESFLSNRKRQSEISKYTNTLPQSYKDAEVIFSCNTMKSIYSVFRKNNSSTYLLEKKVKGKVTDFVTNGKMRTEGSLGAKYYRFTQENTTLIFSESLSFSGYNIEAIKGDQKLYVRCE